MEAVLVHAAKIYENARVCKLNQLIFVLEQDEAYHRRE